MKHKLFFMFLIFELAAAVAFAGLHVSGSTFASPEVNSAQDFPQTALNTRTGQTLVVWPRSQSGVAWDRTILGRIVDANGTTISGELKLAEGVIGKASVTYNPLLNEFLIGYDDEGRILLRRVAASGKPSGKAINITTDPISANSTNYSPKVAFNPSTEGYTVIWTREDGVSGSVVVALSVTKTGKVNGSVLEIQAACCGSWALDLKSLPSGNKMLAVFYEYYDNGSALIVTYYLATLDPNLNSVQVARINTRQAVRENDKLDWAEASLAVLPDSSAMVFYSDEVGTKGRSINPDGKVIGKVFVAFRAPKNTTRLAEPSAVFSTTSNGTRGILVATDHPTVGAKTWAQVLDSTGKSIGAPILVNSTLDTETTRAGQMSALPVAPGNKNFQFQFYQTVGPRGHFLNSQVAPTNTEILKFKLSLTEP